MVWARPASTSPPAAAVVRANEAANDDLPAPSSPQIVTRHGAPARRRAHDCCSDAIDRARPTSVDRNDSPSISGKLPIAGRYEGRPSGAIGQCAVVGGDALIDEAQLAGWLETSFGKLFTRPLKDSESIRLAAIGVQGQHPRGPKSPSRRLLDRQPGQGGELDRLTHSDGRGPQFAFDGGPAQLLQAIYLLSGELRVGVFLVRLAFEPLECGSEQRSRPDEVALIKRCSSVADLSGHEVRIELGGVEPNAIAVPIGSGVDQVRAHARERPAEVGDDVLDGLVRSLGCRACHPRLHLSGRRPTRSGHDRRRAAPSPGAPPAIREERAGERRSLSADPERGSPGGCSTPWTARAAAQLSWPAAVSTERRPSVCRSVRRSGPCTPPSHQHHPFALISLVPATSPI